MTTTNASEAEERRRQAATNEIAAESSPSVPRYPYVHVNVPPDEADVASSELFDLGALGVEERDATTLTKGEGGVVTLVASFDSFEEARDAVAALASRGARLEEVVGDQWRDEWKKYFEPFQLCDGIVVRPPWRPYDAQSGDQLLELEPGRAFGTGLHETTSLCATLLRRFQASVGGKEVLDVGCGSGILSLVALLLGATRARAIDVDDEACAVTRENAARNGLATRVVADDAPLESIEGAYPVVVANIETSVLVPLANELCARVAPKGLLLLSGILDTQRALIESAYGAFVLEAREQKGEWVAYAYRRP
jgi:ribosomal protein L11 methyltransferase